MCEGQVSGPVSDKTSGDPARKPIGVFVLEDQEIVRRGIRVLLEAEPDIQVIGEASTASSALAQIPALRPAVAVLMSSCQMVTGCRSAGRSGRGRRR
jgi:hypothetical protein